MVLPQFNSNGNCKARIIQIALGHHFYYFNLTVIVIIGGRLKLRIIIMLILVFIKTFFILLGHVQNDTKEAFHLNATFMSEEDGHLASHLLNILLLAIVIQDLTRMDYQWRLKLIMVVEHTEYREGKEVRFTTIRQIRHDITQDSPVWQLIFVILDEIICNKRETLFPFHAFKKSFFRERIFQDSLKLEIGKKNLDQEFACSFLRVKISFFQKMSSVYPTILISSQPF